MDSLPPPEGSPEPEPVSRPEPLLLYSTQTRPIPPDPPHWLGRMVGVPVWALLLMCLVLGGAVVAAFTATGDDASAPDPTQAPIASSMSPGQVFPPDEFAVETPPAVVVTPAPTVPSTVPATSPATTELTPAVTLPPTAPPPSTAPVTTPPSSAPSTPPPTSAPPPLTPTVGPGQVMVGSEVQPGRYATLAPGGECLWERRRSITGSTADVIVSYRPSGRAVVEIVPSDVAFWSEGCREWTPWSPIPTDNFGNGDWAVNADIAPGTYDAPGGDGCYWELATGFTHDPAELIRSDLPQGPATVDIAASDVRFTSIGCGLWSPRPEG